MPVTDVYKRLKLATMKENTEKYVAEYLLKYDGNIRKLTIKQIQEECYVSIATPTRLAKSLGYDGFNELKYALVECCEENTEYIPSSIDTFNVFSTIDVIIERLKVSLNDQSIVKILELLSKADEITIFTHDRDAEIAHELQKKLVRNQKFASVLTNIELQEMYSRRDNNGNVAIGIICQGTGSDILEYLQKAKQRGAKVLLFTSKTIPDESKKDFDFNVEVDTTLLQYKCDSEVTTLPLRMSFDIISTLFSYQNMSH